MKDKGRSYIALMTENGFLKRKVAELEAELSRARDDVKSRDAEISGMRNRAYIEREMRIMEHGRH